MQVEGGERVFAVADEDLERESDEKTSAVHFLRFELTREMVDALRRGSRLTMGADHPQYRASVQISTDTTSALAEDFA